LNSKRINGAALDGSEMGRMEIIAVEEAENSSQEKATVIPFPVAASKS